MNARTVKILRILGIAIAILGVVLLWHSRDAIIDGREVLACSMLIVGTILVFAPKAEEPYVYTKKYPTYHF